MTRHAHSFPELSEVELRRGIEALVRELGEEKTRAFLFAAARAGGQKQLSSFIAQALLGASTWAKENPQAALAGAAVAGLAGAGAFFFKEFQRRRGTAPTGAPDPDRQPAPYTHETTSEGFDPGVFAPPTPPSSTSTSGTGTGTGLARQAPRIDPETGVIDVDGYEVR